MDWLPMPPSTPWQSHTLSARSMALNASTIVTVMIPPAKQPAEQTTRVALSLRQEWIYRRLLAPPLLHQPKVQPHPQLQLLQRMTRGPIQALEEPRHQHHPVEARVQTELKLSPSVLAAHMDWPLSSAVYAEDSWFCCDQTRSSFPSMNHLMTVSGN